MVVHAQWCDEGLRLWCENASRWSRTGIADAGDSASETGAPHPYAGSSDELLALIAGATIRVTGAAGTMHLRLPARDGHPVWSPALAHLIGHSTEDEDAPPVMGTFEVPAVVIEAADAARVLEGIEELARSGSRVGVGAGLTFFAVATRFVRHLLAQQRFVPMLRQDVSGQLTGLWLPWFADGPTLKRLEQLVVAMPPAAHAAVDLLEHEPWAVLEEFLTVIGDALCREVMLVEEMVDAIDGRDQEADHHVAWLSGLLDRGRDIEAGYTSRNDLVKSTRRWIGALEDRGPAGEWRLLLTLAEPIDVAGLDDLVAPSESVRWPLTLNLSSVEDPSVMIEASEIWAMRAGSATIEGMRIEAPQEQLLAELGRAARLYKPLERMLDAAEPSEVDLTTAEAYRFLREIRPVLHEQGIGVLVPEWWDSPTVRLGARLRIESDPLDFDFEDDLDPGQASSRPSGSKIGMNSLVAYNWQLAVGETVLTMEQFEQLAATRAPLVMLDGRWVEIRPEDIKAAVQFIGENPGGEMEVGKALRLAFASDLRETGIQITGMEATGWVSAVFGDAAADTKLPVLHPPAEFVGTLRPYQIKGLSWMAFLDRLGIGACLADDMGLGKTVQLLALLLHERQRAIAHDMPRESTLLVVPMSVVVNWLNEARRFTPSLRVHIHHGVDRPLGEAFRTAAMDADIVITTYALAHRDREHLQLVDWARVVLDEAQNIKNPAAKQTRAIREIPAARRFTLTGTPVENRLGELWSIMEFLNPGFLGPPEQFRKRFAVPIERYHDKARATQLRGLVQPFVLRRLKSDPAVITDLPEKVESKEHCYLTPEQATLYEMCVKDMLSAADRAEGIQRRGVVLAGLIKLKQICNHPGHFLREFEREGNVTVDASRSGKCARLIEMLEEVLAAGDQALVFTQFRQMGHMLTSMMQHDLNRDVLFLHGATPSKKRQQMIEAFQKGDGTKPIFVLSLKAGGVGLNLTAANHVFHFDRWWNPAVEAQATDRAYRIGQTRTVQVHKFVVSGTLEERIDEMIESKKELAERVISHGERWLTDLSTSQLRDLLTLRHDTLGSDEPGGQPGV